MYIIAFFFWTLIVKQLFHFKMKNQVDIFFKYKTDLRCWPNQALEQEVCKLGETLGETDTIGQRQEKQQVWVRISGDIYGDILMEILWKYLEKLEILSCKLKTDYQALLEAEQRRLREVKTIFCFIFFSKSIPYIECQYSALVSTAGAPVVITVYGLWVRPSDQITA